MKLPPIPADEVERIEALCRYEVLDTEPEECFDDLVALAAQICSVPIALVSLVDADRQWFKSAFGLGAKQTPRDVSFCGHAVNGRGLFLVTDALADPRFSDNPLVTGPPYVRFYAGAPLTTPEGQTIGTLCVIAHEPKMLSSAQADALLALSRQVVAQLELRRKVRELERTRDELVAASDVRARFLSNMSHEVRTPLAAIHGFAERLAEPDVSESDRPAFARRILAHADDLLAMIGNVMDITQIESGTASGGGASFELEALARDVLEDHRAACDEKGLILDVAVDPLLPRIVRLDRDNVKQIVDNLVRNAVKFTDSGSVIVTFVLDGARRSLSVEVRDTGVGISRADLSRIFDRFVKLEEKTRFRGGLGLGLNIARDLADRLGGVIEVTSAEGSGSTFRLTVPLAPEADQSTAAPRGVDRGASDLPARALLVEDDPDIAAVMLRYLERMGVVAVHVADGEAAMEAALGAERFDLLLLDMQIPKKSGFEVARALREQGYAGPILAVTAFAMEGDRERCLAVGCSDYLAKPVQRAALENAVGRSLRRE